MFTFRESVRATATAPAVEVAFTDSSIDLQGLRPDFVDTFRGLEADLGVPFARLNQVHGDEVRLVDAPMPLNEVPEGDALVTTRPGLGLMIRVADCVPVLLSDAEAGVVAAVHAGRPGMALDIATRTVEVMQEHGARAITAWIGPHVCGSCYEVPAQMREEVAAEVPEAYAETSWGTPALDIGAGVRAQLERAGVHVHDVSRCTREDESLHSYRRDGAAAGRLAGLIWVAA